MMETEDIEPAAAPSDSPEVSGLRSGKARPLAEGEQGEATPTVGREDLLASGAERRGAVPEGEQDKQAPPSASGAPPSAGVVTPAPQEGAAGIGWPEGSPKEMPALQAAPLTAGQIVEGLIVHLDDTGALVDVGTKSEGHIPAEELAGEPGEDRPLAVGDRVSVYVIRPEDEEGSPVLSKKIADYERVWQRLSEAYEKGDVLSAMVTDRVRGGLVVDLGLRGFLPASHVQARNVHALDRFVGQSLKVKIVEVDRGRKRVVVSQRLAVEEERRRRREHTLADLAENQVCRGVIRRITDYGAFVDIGGVDGLLHVTEMSWTRISHPSEVVKVGDRIDVMVLRVDREQNRISLGLKQILPDPWEEAKRLRVGQTVSGTVSRLVPFGAFIRLPNGVEGIVPNAELPGGRGQRAQDVVSVGQTVEAKVVNIRPGERRLTLSLRLVEQAKERRELKEYMDRQRDSSRVTIGDLFGGMLTSTRPPEKPGGEGEGTALSEVEGEPAEGAAAPAEAEAEPPAGGEATALGEGPGEPTEVAREGEAPEDATWSLSGSPAESEAEKD
jgi:4-hydroxy-3-methylbut-2-enyl diphosphate reductase